METKGHNKKLRKSTTPSISRAGSWPFLYSMYRGNRHIFPLGAIKSNPLPRQTYTHTNEAKRRNSSLCNYLCAWHTRWIHTHLYIIKMRPQTTCWTHIELPCDEIRERRDRVNWVDTIKICHTLGCFPFWFYWDLY